MNAAMTATSVEAWAAVPDCAAVAADSAPETGSILIMIVMVVVIVMAMMVVVVIVMVVITISRRLDAGF
jgi:hypothetical protein